MLQYEQHSLVMRIFLFLREDLHLEVSVWCGAVGFVGGGRKKSIPYLKGREYEL